MTRSMLIILLIALVSGITCLVYANRLYPSKYLQERLRKCVVLDKLQASAGYKVRAEFILVMKEEQGMVFDLEVSPATWSQASVNETLYFTLSDQEMRNNPGLTGNQNLSITLNFVGGLILLIGVYWFLADRFGWD